LAAIVSSAACRLAAGLLLVSPCVPLLFMGEEYGETSPFPFFCSFGDAQLAEAVRRGRQAEFTAFAWQAEIPDPQDAATFASARLQWAWPDGSPQAGLRRLYAELLRARRQWPALRSRDCTCELSGGVLVIRRGDPSPASVPHVPAKGSVDAKGTVPFSSNENWDGPQLLVYANLGPLPQPLPPEARGQTILLSSESPRYGGGRNVATPAETLEPYEMILFGGCKEGSG
jgi:maltooligosyltrehalose trehalohydrolase